MQFFRTKLIELRHLKFRFESLDSKANYMEPLELLKTFWLKKFILVKNLIRRISRAISKREQKSITML